MAKKETTKKKATTKKATKKLEEQAPIEIQEFEEAASLEIVEETKVEPEDMGPAEVRQEILDKIKFDDAVLKNLKKEDEKAIEGFETMNGDPSVLTPTEEPKVVDLTDKTSEDAKKVLENAEKMVVYKADSNVIEEVMKEIKESNEEEIKPKKSMFRRMFGYIWNGQEMDY